VEIVEEYFKIGHSNPFQVVAHNHPTIWSHVTLIAQASVNNLMHRVKDA
jgi:hypothetical protein